MLAEGSPVAAVLRRVSPAGIHKTRREVAIERDREGTPPTGENAAHGVAELVLERDAFLLTGVGCDTASLPTSTRFDAERDLRPLVDVRERFAAFSLSLHPVKTRVIEFGRRAAVNRKNRGVSRPDTFAFLGFTFICSKSRRGFFQLQRKTRRDRMQTKLQEIKAELRRRLHQTIPDQGHWLRQVVTGHFAYYAVPTNSRSLSAFRHYVTDLWRRTLRRRSQKDGFTWERMTKLADDWLPAPRILHPWPDQRFAVKRPR